MFPKKQRARASNDIRDILKFSFIRILLQRVSVKIGFNSRLYNIFRGGCFFFSNKLLLLLLRGDTILYTSERRRNVYKLFMFYCYIYTLLKRTYL